MPALSTTVAERAWVELDLEAVAANYRALLRLAGGDSAVLPMVKADAYGLGVRQILSVLEPLAPRGYGVATAREASTLRSLGVERPIVVFSPLPPGSEHRVVQDRVTCSISDLAGLERLARVAGSAGHGADFHVEVDTGMGRCGFDWRHIEAWAPKILDRLGPVRWTGLFTHFQASDAADRTVTESQWRRFRDTAERVAKIVEAAPEDTRRCVGASGRLDLHASNSAAALRWPEYSADFIRPGIFLFGGRPATEVDETLPSPRPVASVRSRVLLVRRVPAGATVGYGATHAARRPSSWGTLGIGYGDGLPRALGNRGSALVRGRRVPIVGRVSMDMTVVDLTDVPDAAVDDVATLIGTDGDHSIALEEVAGLAGTIGYEILTGLAPRLPRIARPRRPGDPPGR